MKNNNNKKRKMKMKGTCIKALKILAATLADLTLADVRPAGNTKYKG